MVTQLEVEAAILNHKHLHIMICRKASKLTLRSTPVTKMVVICNSRITSYPGLVISQICRATKEVVEILTPEEDVATIRDRIIKDNKTSIKIRIKEICTECMGSNSLASILGPDISSLRQTTRLSLANTFKKVIVPMRANVVLHTVSMS